ncbi:hypothetical protein AXF42_Ash016265 [Apostasia shenzhenica]|uniref:Uncharacterized protein n=1 Tax=Apostasia shenzhenica TaxID=1088818 RepID=A0A2H9ZX92_9ASPA|nr:hypothetical protein AXF42_Ash016265 [Apostasia shenzhenica]
MAPRLFACFGRGKYPSSAASASASAESNATVDAAAEEQRRGGPVVVELFSSQGCGTSPEAEAVATRLGRGEIVSGGDIPVIVLAFHVDYWDYRGWKDPYGSSAWTVRQKAYVESLRLDTLYTPQIVVQGRAQCLGNEEDAIAAAVRSAPRVPSPSMQATFSKPSPERLQVALAGTLRSKVDSVGVNVMVALYQSGLVTDINKGENKGRVVANDYVVRRLEKLTTVKDISAKKSVSGTVTFALWDGFNPAKCGIVVFVQNHSLHILGARQFAVPDNL